MNTELYNFLLHWETARPMAQIVFAKLMKMVFLLLKFSSRFEFCISFFHLTYDQATGRGCAL